MVANDPRDRWKQAALVALVGYWLAMFIGTHIPQDQAVSLGNSDKLVHLGAYAGLAILVALNWRLRRAFGLRQALVVLIALTALGAVDEVTQIPVGRQCEFYDWTADVTGAAAALITFLAGSMLMRNRP
jgi:VanZ family protein